MLFLLTARLGWWPVSATAVPPKWESKLAQTTLQAALSHQAAGLTNPLGPSNEILIAGLKSLKMNCSGCHGLPGQPSQWGARSFYPRAPQFTDSPPHLSPQMFVAIKHGVRYSGMGSWMGMMADEEIWKVATFLDRIGSLPPEVQTNWKAAQ